MLTDNLILRVSAKEQHEPLVAALRQHLPGAYCQTPIDPRNTWWLGLDLRLSDPEDGSARVAAFEALETAIRTAGEPQTLGLVDWILLPERRALGPDLTGYKSDHPLNEMGARHQALRRLRLPLLERFFAPGRAEIGQRYAFTEFHRDMDFEAAFLVRQLFMLSTKTGRLPHFIERDPRWSQERWDFLAERLETARWVERVPDYLRRSALARGHWARGLTAAELLHA
jgi:hypothetical protein